MWAGPMDSSRVVADLYEHPADNGVDTSNADDIPSP